MFIACLFVFLEVYSVTPTSRKSWAKNLLIWASPSRLSNVRMALVSFLSGGYNLHRFSDAIGLVIFCMYLTYL